MRCDDVARFVGSLSIDDQVTLGQQIVFDCNCNTIALSYKVEILLIYVRNVINLSYEVHKFDRETRKRSLCT